MSPAPKTKPRANKMDAHIGKRIREIRELANISQEKLAKECGVAFQQIQKYESGANRVAASRLADISKILRVPIYVFFPAEYSVEPTIGNIKGETHV